VVQRRLAGLGQAGGADGAVDQLCAELLLQAAYLRADPGLADVDPLGGPGEIGLLGHRDEVFKLAELHQRI
jgi:hypothetical protein